MDLSPFHLNSIGLGLLLQQGGENKGNKSPLKIFILFLSILVRVRKKKLVHKSTQSEA